MNDSIHLGRLAGIRVGAHWSLLVVFALLTWSLATGLLPSEVPDRSPVAYLVIAVVTTLLFFVSLLAHEMAHALLARRLGMRGGSPAWIVRGTPIVLTVLAGLAGLLSAIFAGYFALVYFIVSSQNAARTSTRTPPSRARRPGETERIQCTSPVTGSACDPEAVSRQGRTSSSVGVAPPELFGPWPT
jgi:hypothetical protein